MQRIGARRYVIFVGAFLVFLCTGTLHMWSVFQKSAIIHFGWSASQISYTYPIMVVSYTVGTFIGGKIQDRIGPRLTVTSGGILILLGYWLSTVISPQWSHFSLYLMFAIPVGFGTGWAYISLLACVQKWFPDRKGFATGFTICGFGLSMVVFSPIAEYLLARLPFTSTMLVFGLFIGAVCITVAQITKNPPEGYDSLFPSLQKPGIVPQKQYSAGTMMRTSVFMTTFMMIILNSPLYFTVNPTLRAYAETRMSSPHMALVAVMCVGAFSTLGRFAIPTLSDRLGRRPMLIFISAAGSAAALLMFVQNGGVFLAAVCVMGLAFGGMPPMQSATVTDLYGIDNAGGNFGFFNTFSGIAILSYPAIINAMAARMPQQRAFSIAFCYCIAIYIVQAVFAFLLPEPKRVAAGEITIEKETAKEK